MRTARAKGLPRWRVVVVHALRNALIPVITVDRAAGRTAALGRDPHRDDLLLARRRQLAGPRRAVARLPGRAGRHPADRDDRHQRQPDRRPAVRRDQSADPACAEPMSDVAAIAADVPPAVPGPLARILAALRAKPRRGRRPRADRACWSCWRSCADVIAPHSPNEQFRDFTLAPPAWHDGGSARFLLGTDPVGRDILSRLIHGTRLSLLIGADLGGDLAVARRAARAASPAIFRGLTETTIMRLMDVMLALPSLLLAIAVVAILGPGLDQRDVRDRHRAAAALRAPDARRGDRAKPPRTTSRRRASPAPARCG